ncbi:MAG: ABC transporter permease [Candidatus Muiribacteriaceae bacterium]
MKKVMIITGKELRSFFYSPLAYVILTIYSLLSGYFFTNIVFETKSADSFSQFTVIIAGFFLLFMPLITMRLFAEENKMGTFELILSYPLESWHLVAGKFIASFLFSLLMLVPALIYVSFLSMYSLPDYGLIFSCIVGLIFLMAAFISIGIFASSLTKNQVIASMMSLGILIFLWSFDFIRGLVDYTWDRMISALSVRYNFHLFSQGVIDSRAVVLFLSITFIMLFLTVKNIEDKRYRS